MEIWELYTEDGRPTGREHVRGEPIPPGLFHLVVHVWLRNSRGQYLISQRAASRPSFPLMWECVCGSVIKGEDSRQGALREVREEVGIDLQGCTGRKLLTQVRRRFGNIVDVWEFECDGPALTENVPTEEVAQSRWLSRDEIAELHEKGLLVSTLGYFFNHI